MDMGNERHYLARVSLYYKMTELTSISHSLHSF